MRRSEASTSGRFRARARRWFADAPRRLALARLHGQIAALAAVEVDAVERPYELHRPPLTDEDRSEVAHLRSVGEAAAARMDRLAPQARELPFYDFIFGYAPGAP